MRMTVPVKALFDYPIEAIAAALPGDTDPLWEVFRLRQKRFAVHDATRTIVFKWPVRGSSGSQAVMAADYAPPALADAAAACAARLEQACCGTVVSLLLTELRPGQRIARHRDGGDLLERTHRCHVPIVTNPSVRFLIDDMPYHLRAGTAYELDNMRPHAVENGGSTGRVHLICNILPIAGRCAPDQIRE